MSDEPFTPEETAIIATVARFVAERVRPNVGKFERDGTYPQALVDEMRELGLYGIAVPERYGGLGLHLPVFATVMEVLSRGWTTLAAYVNSHSTVAYAIATHGTEDQRERYLPELATGEYRASLCLSEPDCGSDLQAIRTTAKTAGQDYVVAGSKTYVTNGARATVLLTLVRHPPEPGEAKPRISLFLIDKAVRNVTLTTIFDKMGFHLVDTVQIELDEAKVGRAQLLGGVEGSGFAQLMDALEVGRIAIAASAVGLAANALSEAKRYAGERRAFGVTIDQHQAIQLKFADMATRLVTARLIAMEAARLKDKGGRCDMITAMAKLHASEAAQEIAHDAVRIHGGAGYIAGQAVERLYREALLYAIGEGTNDINRLVIARRMQGEAEMDYLGLIP